MNIDDDRGSKPIHYAVTSGALDVLKYLIDQPNIDVNIKDNNGLTPLHHAVRQEQFAAFKLLLEHRDIDLTVQNNNGSTPIHYMARNDSIQYLKMFCAQAAQVLSPRKADNENTGEIITSLLNMKNNKGSTPFHIAAYNNSLKVLKFLFRKLRAGGVRDVLNMRDLNGNTPLHYAAKGNSTEDVMKYLLTRRGIEVNARNNEGFTPLHTAADGNNDSVLRVLLTQAGGRSSIWRTREGVDVNAKTTDGKTALELTRNRQKSTEILTSYLSKQQKTNTIYHKFWNMFNSSSG